MSRSNTNCFVRLGLFIPLAMIIACVPAVAVDSGAVQGETVFKNHCSSCHGIGEMKGTFSGIDKGKAVNIINALDEIAEDMPLFEGSEEEGAALADYLISQ